MANWLWSNPDPSNATSAVLSAPFHADAANIGPLVHALLSYQQQQAEARDKSYQDLIKGIASGVSGAYGAYGQNQAAGAANDAANAAIYGTQYPNDPYGGYQDPNRVPDYGGVDALRALDYERKMNPTAFMSDYDKQLAQAKIDATNALAHQRLTGDTSSAPSTPQTYTDDNGQTWRLGSGGHWYPMKTPTTPKVKMSKEDQDAVASIAPEYPPQVVYPQDDQIKTTDQGDASKPKILDAITAKAFLQQAGGDKDKAREMARAAGYIF